PDGPRLRASRQEAAAASGQANECQLRAVGRPAGQHVAKYAGVEVLHGWAAEPVDPDEGMRAAITDEGDGLSVGRPPRLGIVAADVGELSRRFRAGNRRQPQLVPSAPDGVTTVG